MLSVEQAKDILLNGVPVLPSQEVELDKGLNHILSQSFRANMSLPPFRQSAMDGYAVNYTNVKKDNFNLIGEVAAGDKHTTSLNEGDAVRIFTGAAVPDGANAVIMQEWITTENNMVKLNNDAGELKPQLNIRPVGEQIQEGDIALEQGALLNGPALGLIQSFGARTVEVFQKPKVALVVTGNEIVKPGEDLPFGSIYESNSITLTSAIKHAGFDLQTVMFEKDELSAIQNDIDHCSKTSDVVLVSGGISVGDYDFVKTAFENLNVEEVFYKIAQKPGKPIFYGQKENTCFFGLPGNPASALVCLIEYVIPVLKKMAGYKNCFPTKLNLPITNNYVKKGNRAQYLKARLGAEGVEIMNGQASSMLHTFALSDCLVYIPNNKTEINKGESVEVHLINS